MFEPLQHEQILESGSVILLSDDDIAYLKEFRAGAQRHMDSIGNSREAAMQELIDAGIYAEDGQLAAQYR